MHTQGAGIVHWTPNIVVLRRRVSIFHVVEVNFVKFSYFISGVLLLRFLLDLINNLLKFWWIFIPTSLVRLFILCILNPCKVNVVTFIYELCKEHVTTGFYFILFHNYSIQNFPQDLDSELPNGSSIKKPILLDDTALVMIFHQVPNKKLRDVLVREIELMKNMIKT